MNKKTAIIVGGGVAGLAAAVNLDELGYAVTLIEKKPILGGRTYSFTDKITGEIIDNGQHLMVGAYHETLSLLERIGSKHKVRLMQPTRVPLYDGKMQRSEFYLGKIFPPLGLLKALMGLGGFSWSEKGQLIKLGLVVRGFKASQKALPSQLTVNEWLKSLGQSERVRKEFWEVLTLATLNDSPEITSADSLVQVLLGSYFGGPLDGHLVLPQAGLSEIFAEPAKRYLEMRGHRVQTGLALKEVKVLQGEVQGFLLSDGQLHKADLYVSAMPFRPLLQTLTPALRAHPAIRPVATFTSSPIISINLFFDRPVMSDEFVGSSATRVHWFFNRGKMCGLKTPLPRGEEVVSQRRAGEGAHHIIGVISGAYDLLEADKSQLVQMAMQDLERINPHVRKAKLLHALVNKEREATLSSRVGINAQRPEQRLLKNFFILGDWTKTGLPATIESAAVSARRMGTALCEQNAPR